MNTGFNRKTQRTELAVNAVIFFSTLITAAIGIRCGAGGGQVGDGVIGIGYFKPFTMDSNILAAAAALVLLGCGAKNMARGRDDTPKWAELLQLAGTASLSLTMLIAALFLAPVEALNGGSYFSMFSGDMFFFHLVNPLLSVFAFTRLRKKYALRGREFLFGAVPTVMYSVVYFCMVVVAKRWNDFYGFTFGGRYAVIPAVIAAVYALIAGLSLLLTRAHNRGAGGGAAG